MTKRIIFLTEQLEKAKNEINECNNRLDMVHRYNETMRNLYTNEILATKARAEYQHNKWKKALKNALNELTS